MGLTPLEGLVMGTRSGDIDPSIVSYLHREAKMSVDDIESMLNHRSGMLGLAGELDFRRLAQMIESGDSSAHWPTTCSFTDYESISARIWRF